MDLAEQHVSIAQPIERKWKLFWREIENISRFDLAHGFFVTCGRHGRWFGNRVHRIMANNWHKNLIIRGIVVLVSMALRSSHNTLKKRRRK